MCAVRDAGLPGARCRSRACRRRRLEPNSLHGLPMFEGLPHDQILHLLSGASIGIHPPRTPLFDAGSTADAFYILLRGRVKLFALTEDGKESIVEIIHPVTTFAEAAMFASGNYPVSAATIEESDLVRVRSKTFLACLKQNPELGRRILAALFRWNRRLDNELRVLKELTPIRRLAGFLLTLVPEEDGAAVIDLPLKKVVIANRLGMEPESLSRALARLRDLGVSSKGRTVEVADIGKLRAFYTDERPAETPRDIPVRARRNLTKVKDATAT
ncbi:Crp/Fnr family transcriptional regulator [Azospirillum brasilense]|nr:cyclic nucleotide-binding domain-containing protein [Azospirillum brasilense]